MGIGRILSAAFVAAFALMSAAHAQTVVVRTCDFPAPDESAHVVVLDRAVQSFTYGGFSALERHLPALRDAVENAPACYPLIERRGGETIIRISDEADSRLISTALNAGSFNTAQTTTSRNVYGELFLVLASYAVETHRYDEAIAWLDRALALQPHNEFLISEKIAAFMGAERFDEAYGLTQSALNEPALALTLDRPRFLRLSGIVLVDLNRLDDAEGALNESIRLQPNNPIARSELEYIAEVRRGGPTGRSTITAPNAPEPQTQ